jgi:hypothetical protein
MYGRAAMEKDGGKSDLKALIESVLSDILSDKHDCKVTLRFEKKEEEERKAG